VLVLTYTQSKSISIFISRWLFYPLNIISHNHLLSDLITILGNIDPNIDFTQLKFSLIYINIDFDIIILSRYYRIIKLIYFNFYIDFNIIISSILLLFFSIFSFFSFFSFYSFGSKTIYLGNKSVKFLYSCNMVSFSLLFINAAIAIIMLI